MKKIMALVLAVVTLLCCLVGCSSKWTDEDITKSTKIEITKYESDNPNIKVIYTITDEDTVNSFCDTFSNLEVKDTHIKKEIGKSYYVRFLGNGGDIEYVSLIYGHNVIIDSHGDMHKITDDMDINRHLNEVIETAPSEIIWDPDENYTVDLHHPATNWTFGQEDEPPTFSWSLRKCFTKELVIEIDLKPDSYMEITANGSLSSCRLTEDEWETIKANAPTVDGKQKVQWRIRIDPNYHVDLEPFYADWNYFWIANEY